jgi:hypothetical protein
LSNPVVFPDVCLASCNPKAGCSTVAELYQQREARKAQAKVHGSGYEAHLEALVKGITSSFSLEPSAALAL